jgi:ketosteroid isomerase-like protein
MIRNWLAMQLLTHNLRALNAGDLGPTLRLDATDVHFRFPGSSSWAADVRGRDEVETWLRRMVATGIRHSYDQVVLSGPPWRTTVCLRGHDWADGPDGDRVYENHYVIWGTMRWARLQEYEVYEDTEKTVEFDRYLVGLEPPAPR